MKVGEEIKEILIHEIVQDENFEAEAETDLLTSGMLNSMALVRLVSAIETKYSIKIPPTDLVIENFLNIQSIETDIVKRLETN